MFAYTNSTQILCIYILMNPLTPQDRYKFKWPEEGEDVALNSQKNTPSLTVCNFHLINVILILQESSVISAEYDDVILINLVIDLGKVVLKTLKTETNFWIST